MVRGLNVFRERFRPFSDQYVLIGGTAATLAMQDAGLDFRATKDLDVVLHVEALTPQFGAAFWDFVRDGGYELRQVGEVTRPCFYRFRKPAHPDFPFMVELFARAADALRPLEAGEVTPIPIDEAVSSLSAILLDDDYYAFIASGRRKLDGLLWVGEDRLIPLKAVAWLELGERKQRGEPVDSGDVRKHVNDVLRLSQLLAADTRISLNGRVADDMRRFVEVARADETIDPAKLRIRANLPEILARLAAVYDL